MRAFNASEGFSSADDMLPERVFCDGTKDPEPRNGAVVDRQNFLAARESYYSINGWDTQTGNPASGQAEGTWAAMGVPFLTGEAAGEVLCLPVIPRTSV